MKRLEKGRWTAKTSPRKSIIFWKGIFPIFLNWIFD